MHAGKNCFSIKTCSSAKYVMKNVKDSWETTEGATLHRKRCHVGPVFMKLALELFNPT